MISANDTTIIAILSRYPDMPSEEADEYIARIHYAENIPICHAVIGRIDKEALQADARQVFEEFQRWSEDRTRRTRNEEWNARRRRKETRLALRLTELHEQGIIPSNVLLMYGVSGEMPDQNVYMRMTPEEKERLWQERMENRFGPNWLERFADQQQSLPIFRRRFKHAVEHNQINWLQEGF